MPTNPDYAKDIVARTAGSNLRVATFNCENLFARPIAMSLDDNAKGQPYIDANKDLNTLFEKPTYRVPPSWCVLPSLSFVAPKSCRRVQQVPLRRSVRTVPKVPLKGIMSIAVLLMGLLPQFATATEMIPMSLRATARKSKWSFAATVDSIRYGEEAGAIITDVYLSGLKYVHGSPRTRLTLRLQGGRMNGKEYGVDGMPRFEQGRRYVLLTDDHSDRTNRYLPIVGLSQGFFPIVAEAPGGPPVVHDWEHRPIIAVKGNHLAVLGRPKGESGSYSAIDREFGLGERGIDTKEPALEIYPKELDPGSRLSEEAFLKTIEKLTADIR